MLVVGLTGGIAMGKTTLSRMLSKRGIPVVDADAIVHQLYSEGGRAVPAVRAAFPSAVIADRVDRTRLASLVVGRKDEFKRLESIVHPLVAEERASRVREFEQKGKPLVFLDIPLLFETGQFPAHPQHSDAPCERELDSCADSERYYSEQAGKLMWT